jgi:alanyl-tRNA synthetase
MTDRLYYRDSFRADFTARVREISTKGGRPAVTLDRSAFYPTSGGQLFDTGTLALEPAWGEPVRVIEVVELPDGEVLHSVEEQLGWLQAGATVRGQVDVARRRDHMQQHSGQHVLSAAFTRLFAMPTVSFHMGAEGR